MINKLFKHKDIKVIILEKRKINKPDKTNNDEDDGPEELQVKGINC